MDLLDSEYLNLLKEGYSFLKKSHKEYGLEIPKNLSLIEDGDLIKRFLNCAVIETIHQFNKDTKTLRRIHKDCHESTIQNFK